MWRQETLFLKTHLSIYHGRDQSGIRSSYALVCVLYCYLGPLLEPSRSRLIRLCPVFLMAEAVALWCLLWSDAIPQMCGGQLWAVRPGVCRLPPPGRCHCGPTVPRSAEGA